MQVCDDKFLTRLKDVFGGRRWSSLWNRSSEKRCRAIQDRRRCKDAWDLPTAKTQRTEASFPGSSGDLSERSWTPLPLCSRIPVHTWLGKTPCTCNQSQIKHSHYQLFWTSPSWKKPKRKWSNLPLPGLADLGGHEEIEKAVEDSHKNHIAVVFRQQFNHRSHFPSL